MALTDGPVLDILSLFSMGNNALKRTMKIGYKVWLDHNGKAFGDGPYELLRRVEKRMSLHQASRQMNMSYSKAWRLIHTMEERLGFTLLERKVGGQSGGGSRVTLQGKDLMDHYERFRREVEKNLEKIYQKHFGSFLHRIPVPAGERRSCQRAITWLRRPARRTSPLTGKNASCGQAGPATARVGRRK
jgi:molybdate transport system regulatory protein